MNDEQLMTAVREEFSGVRMGTPLVETVRWGRALRARRRVWGAAGVVVTAALAGATAMAVTAPGGGTSGPALSYPASASVGPGIGAPTGGTGTTLDAWTVTAGPGGTVDVTVRQLSDAAGLQRALQVAGVPARVAFQDGTPSDSPPLPTGCVNVALSDEANAKLQSRILGPMMNALQGIALSLYPRKIPKGMGIYLAIKSGSDGDSWGWGLDLVQATPGCTG
jgi:hypothetical protein